MTGGRAPERGWTARGLSSAATVACGALTVGAVLGYLVSHERPTQRTSGPHPAPSSTPITTAAASEASPAELAVLAPLRVGGSLRGFDITAIDHDVGMVQMVCRRDHATVRLDVTLAADAGPTPPAMAGPYAVFYEIDGASQAAGEELALALAAVLQRNSAAPPPPSLTRFNVRDP